MLSAIGVIVLFDSVLVFVLDCVDCTSVFVDGVLIVFIASVLFVSIGMVVLVLCREFPVLDVMSLKQRNKINGKILKL